MSINKVLISGNLTRDAELRATANGLSILSFAIAVNDRRRNAHGEWEDYANFVDCAVLGRRAEAIARYMVKGTKVAIEGRLHYSSWEDKKGGGRRSKLEVTVGNIEFMSRNQGGHGGQGGYDSARSGVGVAARERDAEIEARVRKQAVAAQQSTAEAVPPAAYATDDIPF